MKVSSVMMAVSLLLACVAPACSSSSGAQTVVDAGEHHDATKTPDDGGKEAAAACVGLDAAVQGLTFSSDCESCIGTYCCTQGLACAAATGCKTIEECAAECVAMGTAAQTCAQMCIAPDGGSTANLSPAQNAAYTLDLCLAQHCSTFCG